MAKILAGYFESIRREVRIGNYLFLQIIGTEHIAVQLNDGEVVTPLRLKIFPSNLVVGDFNQSSEMSRTDWEVHCQAAQDAFASNGGWPVFLQQQFISHYYHRATLLEVDERQATSGKTFE